VQPAQAPHGAATLGLPEIKYALSCITAVLYYIFTLGDRYHPLPIEELNNQLIFRQCSILREFLTNAECDFEKALHNAIDYVRVDTMG
jgi:hypothetical protein